MILILDDTSEHDAHVSEKGNLIISRQLVTSTPTLKVDTSLGLRIQIGFTRIRIQNERKKNGAGSDPRKTSRIRIYDVDRITESNFQHEFNI